MPMIDVYSVDGTFSDKHALARDLASAVMRWEKVPDLPLFRKNTAAFVHDLPTGSISNVDGDENYVRVQVLTPAGVLGREKQLGVVRELTAIVAAAPGGPHPPRTNLGLDHRVSRWWMGGSAGMRTPDLTSPKRRGVSWRPWRTTTPTGSRAATIRRVVSDPSMPPPADWFAGLWR